MDFKELVLESEKYSFFRNSEIFDRIGFLVIGGSYLYGTNTKNSDLDIRGFYYEPVDELLNPTIESKTYEYQDIDNKIDIQIHPFNKFLSLILKCCPNTLYLVGAESDKIIYCDENAEHIIKNAKVFSQYQQFYDSHLGLCKSLVHKNKKLQDRMTDEECLEEYLYLQDRINKNNYHRDRIAIMILNSHTNKRLSPTLRKEGDIQYLQAIRYGASELSQYNVMSDKIDDLIKKQKPSRPLKSAWDKYRVDINKEIVKGELPNED